MGQISIRLDTAETASAREPIWVKVSRGGGTRVIGGRRDTMQVGGAVRLKQEGSQAVGEGGGGATEELGEFGRVFAGVGLREARAVEGAQDGGRRGAEKHGWKHTEL